mgnify:CR=1 FL=1
MLLLLLLFCSNHRHGIHFSPASMRESSLSLMVAVAAVATDAVAAVATDHREPKEER